MFVVLPDSIEQQRLCRYLAGVTEYDSIPCYQNLIGIFLPWSLAAILVHMQCFVQLINFSTLICLSVVSISCTLLMWSLQLDEAMQHEQNFRETMRRLVI